MAKEYLIVVNSYGNNVGELGFYYIHKDIVNKYFRWATYIAIDMTKEEAKNIVWGTKEQLWDYIIKTTQSIIIKFNEILNTTRNLASVARNSYRS